MKFMDQLNRLKIQNILMLLFVLMGCTQSKELGSKDNPFKFFLVPAQDTLALVDSGKTLQKYLEQETGLSVRVELPVNYISVVEAFGSNRADAAIINTFGYIIAHQKYGVQPRLRFVNRGRDEYYGQIIAHVDGIKNIKDISGKKFGFVDPASSSGYLLPLRLFKQEGIKPKEQAFLGRHDTVVQAVYQKKIAAGATFYTPPDDDGTPKDARWLLRTQYPDVYDKVKILKLTGPIPNDPIVFRKDVPESLKKKITEAMIKYVTTAEGKKTLMDMYHITGFKSTTDADYEVVRQYLKDIDRSADDFLK